jgi:hypothetical protein
VRFLQGSDHAPPRSSILLHLVGPPDGDETAAVARGYPYYSAMLMDDWKLCVAQQPTTSNALSCPAATLFGAGMPAVCLTHLDTAPGGGEQDCRHGRSALSTASRRRPYNSLQCIR